jgi:hypothetical protein
MNTTAKKLKKQKEKSKKRKSKSSDHKKKKKHRSTSSSSSSSCSSSSSSSSDDERKRHRKEARRLKRESKKMHKINKQLRSKSVAAASSSTTTSTAAITIPAAATADYGIPIELMNSKAKAPQTREEYEAKQSIIRKVVDTETGRTRLIRGNFVEMVMSLFLFLTFFSSISGDGEVIEEIVTKDRHKDINKAATKQDGANFEKRTIGWNVSGNL